MEARFAQLETLITSMATQVKFTTFGSGKAKDRENGSNVDPRLFCGVGFLRLMAPNESMPRMLEDHGLWAVDDGNHVTILNPNFHNYISDKG